MVKAAPHTTPNPITFAPGVHPSAVVDPTAKLGARVSIQPYAVIEAGVSIGDGTIIGRITNNGTMAFSGTARLVGKVANNPGGPVPGLGQIYRVEVQ